MSTLGGDFGVVRGPLAGQVGIRKSDATKPFIPRHKYKMAPQRLTNSSGRSLCLCVLKNTHERERERMQQLPGSGQMGRAVQPVSRGRGKIYMPQKKHKHSQHLPNLIKMQLRTGVIS